MKKVSKKSMLKVLLLMVMTAGAMTCVTGCTSGGGGTHSGGRDDGRNDND
jgi:hypothetical protein